MLCQFGYAHHSFLNLLLAFKLKRYGDNTHREDIHLARDLSHNGRSTRTRTTTHTSGNEEHLCTIVECLTDTLATLLCILLRNLRFASCSPARS